ncbi:hypothetical protein ACHWQZ_G004244 [Mnemiopsis leidyi]
MVERTRQFKVEVKKQRNLTGKQGTDTDILPSKAHHNQFTKNATSVLKTIKQLDELVEETKDKYIGSPCSNEFSSLSDQQRLDIDMSANMFMVQCKDAISSLSTLVSEIEGQLKAHQEGVIFVLTHYLKLTCDKFSRTKAIHVKQTLEQHRLAKLSSHRNTINKIRHMDQVEEYAKSEQDFVSTEDLGLSPEEVQMMELENENMYSELTALSSEVQNIEGTVMEISRLQEIFTEKVLTQSEQIFELHRTAVETTENTRSGNEELREAIKNSAGFRVWLLFFFVMASCCLLFLDWYN